MTVSENVLTTHQRVIDTCSLYNIVPRGVARAWEPQHELWKGKLVVDELLALNSTAHGSMGPPSLYRFRFVGKRDVGVEANDEQDEERLFCETQVISNMEQFCTVIQKKDKWYQVAMLCEGQQRFQIALELRVRDPYQMQLMEDLMLRIRDEYEIFQQMW